MIRRILNWFGRDIEYVCDWGVYTHRYDSLDAHAGRPIHRGMSVAPPWAKSRIIRKNSR